MKKKIACFLILASFLCTNSVGLNFVYARDVSLTTKAQPIDSVEDGFHLPAPGILVHLSPEFNPPILRGVKVHPENPFRFDFILDQGDVSPNAKSKESSYQEQLKQEATTLVKYFLASLTTPEKDLWVNLSPYEKERIIPESFGQTEMGRDLLAEDYMLKQITASLIYPEGRIGKKFWKRIYEQALRKFGTTNIPVKTFNKVWIVPQRALVYENVKAASAYVMESKLKVMLEEDYLAVEKNLNSSMETRDKNNINTLSSQIIREIVIPELTREVNEDKNFSKLRQVYNSLILASWYKKKIKDSILSEVYIDKNKIAGVNINDPKEKNKIYERYLKAFKKGVYNYIKEEIPSDLDGKKQEISPRKYFSGGIDCMNFSNQAMTIVSKLNRAMAGIIKATTFKGFRKIMIQLNLVHNKVAFSQDGAMLHGEINQNVKRLVDEWNSSGENERWQMLERADARQEDEFLMYVLLDDSYIYRRMILGKAVLPISLNNFSGIFGLANAIAMTNWMVQENMLEGIRMPGIQSNIFFPEFRMKPDFITGEVNLRTYMGDNKNRFNRRTFDDLMRIFQSHYNRFKLVSVRMPVDDLLEHLSKPWISLDYGLPILTDSNQKFNEDTGLSRKRISILMVMIERILEAGFTPRDIYLNKIKVKLKLEARGVSDWINDFQACFNPLMHDLNLRSGPANILGEKVQMNFWVAFFRMYIYFKWLDNHGRISSYKEDWDNVAIFRKEGIVPIMTESDDVSVVLNKIDREFNRAQLAKDPQKDKAMPSNTGGIDLRSNKISVNNNGEVIKFHTDAAQLAQLENASGLVPVVIDMEPMADLKEFSM